MLIEERVEFDDDPSAVWGRLSDIERIPEFWHGTRSLLVLRKETGPGEERVKARAKFAFGGSGEVEITAKSATMTLTTTYLSGPFRGTQVVKIIGKVIEAEWEVDFNGLFKLASGRIGKHFASGTLHALERLSGKEVSGQEIAQA